MCGVSAKIFLLLFFFWGVAIMRWLLLMLGTRNETEFKIQNIYMEHINVLQYAIMMSIKVSTSVFQRKCKKIHLVDVSFSFQPQTDRGPGSSSRKGQGESPVQFFWT